MTWLTDLEAEARTLLPDYVHRYVAGSAGGGESIADAEREWNAVRFRPRAFADTSSPSTRTTVLGMPVRTPILAAPMAQQNAATPDAEIAMARAVREAGSVLGVSTNTSVSFDAIAAEDVPWWFQIYMMRDRGLSDALVDRAVAAGARAIILTVDTTSLNGRGHLIEPGDWPEIPGKKRLANLLDDDLRGLPDDATAIARDTNVDVITDLRDRSGLDVLVKGVVRGDDAVACADAGAAGVIVSTHGGRRLGRSVSSIHALPEVLDAVGTKCEVFVDSGVRSGDHVAAALALGARGVFVGRPLMWGLATGGSAGAADVLRTLTEEFRITLDRMGAGTIADLTRDLVELR